MAIERASIVKITRSWLGTPYHHQASVKGAGTDCLGLLRGVYRELYDGEPERVPNYSPDWAEATGEETLLKAAHRHLQEQGRDTIHLGDVLFFRMCAHGPAKHCGIMTSENRFTHAWTGHCVAEVPFTRSWQRRLVTVFSFPEVN